MLRLRLSVVFVALVGCGSSGRDKCERAFGKLTPAMKKEQPNIDVSELVAQCKDQLAKRPEYGKILDCIIATPGTPSIAELDKCAAAGGRADIGESRKKYQLGGEAGVALTRLGDQAKAAFVKTGAYPKGTVGPTPQQECCAAGGKCPADPAAWRDPVWQALEFSIPEAGLYRYSYESDGTTFTARAVGDTDCDTTMATFTLTGSSDGTIELTQPPKGSH
jgi:hypothetical protein